MNLSVSNSSIQPYSGYSGLSRADAPSSRSTGSTNAEVSSQAKSASKSDSTGNAVQLTPEEQQLVAQLKQTDSKVRAHEQAHLRVGADLVRSRANYSYQTGPDNRRYAVGGEVSIDTSSGRTPEETIPKAQHIRATALAPADPSPQDHSVAAQATRMESEARMELAVQKYADQSEPSATEDAEGDAGMYQRVAQGDGGSSPIGGYLDSFA